jgi:tetratricopeptide (TPR) repeat protein
MVQVGDGMVRWVAVVAACAIAVWLGAVQIASSAAYGDLAVRPSLPAVLHAAAPRLLRSLVGGPKARAAAAVHDGDLDEAEHLVAGMRDDPDVADLRGQIAEARGQRDAAIDAYVSAGDVVRAQSLIDRMAGPDLPKALVYEERLVARLRDDPNAGEVLGEAWWRLAQLQAGAGYRNPAEREHLWLDAEASYERALELAPNEETYLLGAAYQSLANGDTQASLRYYQRAADVVPNSLDAWVGLAWAASMAHDCASARRYFSRAQAVASAHPPPSDRPGPFANELAGQALSRCVR